MKKFIAYALSFTIFALTCVPPVAAADVSGKNDMDMLDVQVCS